MESFLERFRETVGGKILIKSWAQPDLETLEAQSFDTRGDGLRAGNRDGSIVGNFQAFH
jgi:hypothetical protein